MANVIAVIWDCDKTLIDGYMQDPIFAEYGVDPASFWKEVELGRSSITGARVNADTYYLNHFIHCARSGRFAGLDNKKLRDFGAKQKFYPGIPDIFEETCNMFRDDPGYSEYGITVEHYIVSTGFAELLRGSVLAQYVKDIWGCELTEGSDINGDPVISEIIYTIDNTTKTRALFEINKGPDVEVNAKIPMQMRRVRFENMIYIADGPSDIPAFSVVRQNGGSTFAIYPKGDLEAMYQVEKMREAGRVDMYAEADYSHNTTANMWITGKIRQIADRIRREEKEKIVNFTSDVPRHLT